MGECIYYHSQTNCFVVSQLFSVARHVGRLKPGSKSVQLYVRLCIGQQAYPVGLGIIRYYVATAAAAFVCLHFLSYQSAQFVRIEKHWVYIYIYIYIYIYTQCFSIAIIDLNDFWVAYIKDVRTIVFIFFIISTTFRRYVHRPSSGVCRTREPTRNFELRPLFNPRGSPVLIPLAITG